MFDKKTVDAYKRISAPPELRKKVMELERKNSGSSEKRSASAGIKTLAAIAACAAIVMLLYLPSLLTFGDVSISMAGQVISSEPYAISAPDTRIKAVSGEIPIPLVISAGKGATITVSHGYIEIDDSLGEIKNFGSEAEVTGDVTVTWMCPESIEGNKAELCAESSGKTLRYLVLRDSVTGIFKIQKTH